jgi:hypothetical protein
MQFSKKLFIWYVLIFAYSISCKKFVQVQPPEEMITVGTVFSNDSMASDAIRGLYIKIMGTNQSLLNGCLSIYPALSADELQNNYPKVDDDQFFKNTLLPDNGTITTNFWRSGYGNIYLANICIENLSRSANVSSETKKQLTGEAKFFRALCYMYLVNTFGDVPLITSTNVDINMQKPRSLQSDIHSLILTDLRDAWLSLTSKGATETSPDQFAAAALLAREYCYLQNWEQAEVFCSISINKGKFQLETDLNNVFLATSRETIFHLAPVWTNNSTSEGYAFVPSSSSKIPQYSLTDSLLMAFEQNDLRKSAWTKSLSSNGKAYFFPSKYKINVTSQNATEYNVVLRLAEQYLIRAEARIHQNNLAGALEDINLIRQRAGLSPVATNASFTQCIAALEHERRIEFFAEWGHRWFDLKRTNKLDTVLSSLRDKDWQTTDRFYPIPLQEIKRNPTLWQNIGY